MSDFDPNSDGAIDALVQRVNLALDAKGARMIVFIAARAGEGTSTIARSFAEAMADTISHKVLLIDAGPLDKTRFVTDGVDPSKGIAEAVASGAAATDAIHSLDDAVDITRWLGREDNRRTAAKLVHDSTFWQSLQNSYDTIVIDAPALQTSSEGIAFAAQANGTIIVVEAEATRQPVVEKLRDTLINAGAKIVGSVLNKRQLYIPSKVYARL